MPPPPSPLRPAKAAGRPVSQPASGEGHTSAGASMRWHAGQRAQLSTAQHSTAWHVCPQQRSTRTPEPQGHEAAPLRRRPPAIQLAQLLPQEAVLPRLDARRLHLQARWERR